MNLCATTKYIRTNFISSICRFSTTIAESEQAEPVLIDDTEEEKAREAEIEKKRNKSRLSSAHYNIINGRPPYEEPKSLAHLTVKYNRKMYGKYGSVSGVNPSLCWPTKQDIEERQEYESVAFPYTIKEMMVTVAENRREQKFKIEQREKDIAVKFAKLDQWKKELETKLAKKTAEVQAAKQKKERLVDEVRRHFGFNMDPKDERFQEMLAKREKEQKKQEKLAKKEAKDRMMFAKIQQQNSDTKEKS